MAGWVKLNAWNLLNEEFWSMGALGNPPPLSACVFFFDREWGGLQQSALEWPGHWARSPQCAAKRWGNASQELFWLHGPVFEGGGRAERTRGAGTGPAALDRRRGEG